MVRRLVVPMQNVGIWTTAILVPVELVSSTGRLFEPNRVEFARNQVREYASKLVTFRQKYVFLKKQKFVHQTTTAVRRPFVNRQKTAPTLVDVFRAMRTSHLMINLVEFVFEVTNVYCWDL